MALPDEATKVWPAMPVMVRLAELTVFDPSYNFEAATVIEAGVIFADWFKVKPTIE